jgi:hypothetical protein
MGTTDGQAATQSGGASCHIGGHGSRRWFGQSRSLVIATAIAAVALAGALALSEHSLAVTNLLPLLYVLPCAAMMLMCMKGMHHGRQSGTTETSSQNEAPGTTR